MFFKNATGARRQIIHVVYVGREMGMLSVEEYYQKKLWPYFNRLANKCQVIGPMFK